MFELICNSLVTIWKVNKIIEITNHQIILPHCLCSYIYYNTNILAQVPVDSHSIAWSRTASELLPIVYLGGKGKGGFFPNGLNGNIK